MASRHDVTIPVDDQTIAATLVTPQHPSGAGVLFVHGLGSDRLTNLERAQALADALGVTCLAIDLRGHGASSGRLSQVTPAQNLRDVVCAVDALTSRPGVDHSRIGVCGASYGAYLSVLLAAERDVARLALRAPALYADDVVGSTLSARRLGDATTSARALSVLAATTVPMVIVESEHDEVIPHAVIETYLRARDGIEHVVLPGARHALTDPRWRANYQQVLLAFFSDL